MQVISENNARKGIRYHFIFCDVNYCGGYHVGQILWKFVMIVCNQSLLLLGNKERHAYQIPHSNLNNHFSNPTNEIDNNGAHM